MAGEINYFRKRFLGGFNRQDVVDYIAKLAKERNESTAAKEKAENEAKKLNAEIVSIRAEMDEARLEIEKVKKQAEAARLEAEEARQEAKIYKNEALEEAIETITKFEVLFENANTCIKSTIASLCDEIEKARGTVAGVPSVLDGASVRLSELRMALTAEKDQGLPHEAPSMPGTHEPPELLKPSELFTTAEHVDII